MKIGISKALKRNLIGFVNMSKKMDKILELIADKKECRFGEIEEECESLPGTQLKEILKMSEEVGLVEIEEDGGEKLEIRSTNLTENLASLPEENDQ